MKIPAFIVQFAIRQFAPTAAQDIAQGIVWGAMVGLQQSSKLPAAFASHYDAQEVATWLQDGLAMPGVAALCDRAGWDTAMKAKLLADIVATPAVIPVERGTAV
jgi:hypothetical protein